MKPTKEQLADPKWWDENANGYDYVFYLERNDEYLFADDNGEGGNFKLIVGGARWKLLAKRPEPEVLETDWLKEGVNVTTPKGIAEVYRVTEDDGVYTSLGNFCRSVLSEVKPEWKPEVGVECCGNTTDAAGNWSWQKVEPLKDMGNGEFACYTGNKILRYVDQFRPKKTQREEFIEEAKSRIKNMDKDDIILAGKLYDADCRFDLTEKDGE